MLEGKSCSLTFKRHDKRNEAPRGFFDMIEERFNDRLQCAGNVELWIGEWVRGTAHRKGLKISRLNGRAIEGVCQPGSNDTCYKFRALVHSPLVPERVLEQLTAPEEEKAPPISRVVIEIGAPPPPTLNPDEFWNTSRIDLLVSLIGDASVDESGYIPKDSVRSTIVDVIEDGSGVSNPNDELIINAVQRLVLAERLYPVSLDRKVLTHFSLTPVTAAVEKTAAAGSTQQTTNEPSDNPTVQNDNVVNVPSISVSAATEQPTVDSTAPQSSIVTSDPAPAASETTPPRQKGPFGDLFQNEGKLSALEAELMKNADPVGATLSYQSTLAVFCRFLKGLKIDVDSLRDATLGGGLSQLTRRKVLEPLGQPHEHKGYRVVKRWNEIQSARTTKKSDSEYLEPAIYNRLVTFFTSDEGCAVVGSELLKAGEATNFFLPFEAYWQAIKRAVSLRTTNESVAQAAHSALKDRYLDGGHQTPYGVGFRLRQELIDLVEHWEEIWLQREADHEAKVLEEHRARATQAQDAGIAIQELRASRDKKDELPSPTPQRRRNRKASQTTSPEVAVEEKAPAPPSPPIAGPETSQSAPKQSLPIGSSIDQALTDVEKQIEELKRQQELLLQTKIVGETLKTNPDAAQAVKDMISEGNLDGLKKLLGLD